MTAPNILAAQTIYGKTEVYSIGGTSAVTICNNAASSGKVKKVVSLIVSNDDGSNSVNVTVSIASEDDGGGTLYRLSPHIIPIPAGGSLIVVDKNTPIYLEEDKSIVIVASAANDVDVTVVYEEIG